MWDLYNSFLGGEQVERLDDIVAILHEKMLGMHKTFSDLIVTKIIKTDKTTNELHGQWDKKHGQTCKTLAYQDGAKKDPMIDIIIKETLLTRKPCSINQIHEKNEKRKNDKNCKKNG